MSKASEVRKSTRTLLSLVLVAAGLQGCATPQMHDTVPAKLADAAQVADMNNVRLWGDAGPETTARLFRAEAATIKAKYTARAVAGRPLEANILALSGGADDGAFGAGLLVGWSERGTRPEFDLVTGVSTGALIAPFVFVGRDYDSKLAEIFVKHSGEDIYQAKLLSGLLGGVAVADNAPLARLIERYVDRRLLARVARERTKGRVQVRRGDE